MENRNFHIAYVTEQRGLGGGETSLLNLMASMNRAGHSALLVSPAGELQEGARMHGVMTHEAAFPDVHLLGGMVPQFSAAAVWRLVRCFAEHEIDVVHVESLLALYYAGMASRLSRRPCVATYHGYWPVNSAITRAFIRHGCTHVFPVSRSVACELETRGRIAGSHMTTIPLSLGSSFFAPSIPKAKARHLAGLPADRPVIMQVARFQEIKGQHHALETLNILMASDRELNPLLVFVGGTMNPASDEIRRYKCRVERRAAEPDMQPCVHFAGHQNDVRLFMSAADVILVPSQYETFSMATIEAMALGKPVIAFSAGGPAEIITHGKNGLLVPAGDLRAMAESVRTVLVNPSRAAELGREASTSARQLYHPDSRSTILLSLYRQYLGMQSDAPAVLKPGAGFVEAA